MRACTFNLNNTRRPQKRNGGSPVKKNKNRKHSVAFRGTEQEVNAQFKRWKRLNRDKGDSKIWKTQDGKEWVVKATYWSNDR